MCLLTKKLKKIKPRDKMNMVSECHFILYYSKLRVDDTFEILEISGIGE
jgi:hypothetical protein